MTDISTRVRNTTAILITTEWASFRNSTDVTDSSDVYVQEVIPWIWVIFPVIVLTFGVTGNILSIIVFSRKKMAKGTMPVYLITLAIVDILSLVLVLIPYWIFAVFGINLVLSSDVACKAARFVAYFLTDYSAWILVAITTERALVIRFPHSASFTKQKAALVLLVLAVSLIALTSHVLYGFRITSDGACWSITDDKRYDYFLNKIWPWVDMATFSILPFTCLLAGNAAIILESRRIRHEMRNITNREATASHGSQHLTKLLSALTVAYLVYTLPVTICNAVEIVWPHLRKNAFFSIVAEISEILMPFNNASNFYLYCLTGANFRSELAAILGCSQRRVDGKYQKATK